jgi:hypothetical protein
MFAYLSMRTDAPPAEISPLLDIVDREINGLARNAKGLAGFQQDETGRNRLKRDGTGQNWLKRDGTGSEQDGTGSEQDAVGRA